MKQPRETSDLKRMATLGAGIVAGAAGLLSKQFSAASLELKENLAATKSAGAGALAGLVLLLSGLWMGLFTIVYLIHALAALDLWICFGIVAGALLIIGLLILLGAKRRMAAVSVYPSKSLDEAKKDWIWLTVERKSGAR